ncbi:MAG: aromatic-ring-hydroxylating dioxygenase, beta subunit [Nocardioidaceae bacterium]|nr:aromatic-ring-hydroxylating dioxygenase, beta subunit [Nocardioidaceae bacterium]
MSAVAGPRVAQERPALADAATYAEICQFLAHEADLLDARRFHAWMDVVTDDYVYLVPTPRTPDTPYKPHWDERVMLIDESKWSLSTQWFRRFDEDIYETAWGENPPVRFRHLVTNLRITALADDEFEVRSNVALVATRQSDAPKYLSGERTDHLVRRDGLLYLSRRFVVLDQVLIDFPQLRILL